MKKIIIGATLVLACLACKETTSSSGNTIETAYAEKMDEVIGVHDEVMPKMGTISTLISQLETKLAETTEDDKEKYQEALTSLKEGHDLMMEWMKDFADKFPNALDENPGFSEAEYQEKMELLAQEEHEVKEMRNHVLGSIEKAKAVLNN